MQLIHNDERMNLVSSTSQQTIIMKTNNISHSGQFGFRVCGTSPELDEMSASDQKKKMRTSAAISMRRWVGTAMRYNGRHALLMIHCHPGKFYSQMNFNLIEIQKTKCISKP